MKIYKPFLAGMALPSFMLPFICILFYLFKGEYSVFLLIVPFVPLVWGIWNVLFVNFENVSPIIDREINIWLWGAFLGLLFVSLMSVFDLPKMIFNIQGFMSYGIFFIVPLIYGLVWRYFVKYFNECLDLF